MYVLEILFKMRCLFLCSDINLKCAEACLVVIICVILSV